MKKIAIFASGSGSNAEKIHEYFVNRRDVSIVKIFTNNPNAGVIERCERLGISYEVFDRAAYKSGQVLQQLIDLEVDLVVLAGFLWLIPSSFVAQFPNRIVNLHPSLLPKYGGKGMYGHFVHEAVVANREKISGITIHFVNEQYDKGAIIFQGSFEVLDSDSAVDVARKGAILEHQFFPEQIDKVLENL